jgi:tight adherence protein C
MNPALMAAYLQALAAFGHARWDAVIAPDLGRLVWPAACALGAALVVGRGRRPLPLAERLRQLDLDARVRETVDAPRDRPTGPRLPGLLGVLFGPLIGDAANFVEGFARRLAPGLIGGEVLERELRLVWPGRGVGVHVWRKVAGALALGLFWPVAAALDGPQMPPVVWLCTAAVGFLLPDLELRARLEARRKRVVAALPPICDQLSIALAAGLSPELAVRAVVEASVGELADELRWTLALMQGSGATMPDALDTMDRRNQVPEVSGLVGALRSAYQHGGRAGALVAAHADGLRASERARVVEQGGRAMTRMVLPVGIFMLPVMAVVLIVPALAQFVGLSGG